jgi:hypothetical protein
MGTYVLHSVFESKPVWACQNKLNGRGSCHGDQVCYLYQSNGFWAVGTTLGVSPLPTHANFFDMAIESSAGTPIDIKHSFWAG